MISYTIDYLPDCLHKYCYCNFFRFKKK